MSQPKLAAHPAKVVSSDFLPLDPPLRRRDEHASLPPGALFGPKGPKVCKKKGCNMNSGEP